MKKRFLGMWTSLFLAVLACRAVTGQPAPLNPSGKTPAPQTPAFPSETTAPQAASPLAPLASQAETRPGILCLGSVNAGLVCLDEAGWALYTEQNSPLTSNYITHLAACPNGQMVIAHYNSFDIYDGKTWKSLPFGRFNSVEGISCGADGSLWVAHYQGVSHYADGQWSMTPSSRLASGESASSLVYDIDSGPDGRMWVTTPHSVALLEQDNWHIFQQGQGFEQKMYFDQLALNEQGLPIVSGSDAFLRLEGGVWQFFPAPEYLSSIEDAAWGKQDSLWLATNIKGLYQFQGGAWQHFSQNPQGLSSNQLNAVTVDSQGRVWVGSDYGLSVFDGQSWQTYRMDNSPLPSNVINSLVVFGAGPGLPAPEQKEAGSLGGRLKDSSGAPIAAAEIEICPQPLVSPFSGDTPCSDQPFFLQTQTNAEGRFFFTGVPAGEYSIAARVNGQWVQISNSFGLSQQVLVNSGQTSEIGDLTVAGQ